MECNRDEALRAKEIAERKFTESDFVGAKKFAVKAQALFPGLDGISQMIDTLDVHVAAGAMTGVGRDWYAILRMNPWDDEETVKKQYRKLALALHPDKNKSVGAEAAFMLVLEASKVLSDKSKRMVYDRERKLKVGPKPTTPSPNAFNDSRNVKTDVANLKTRKHTAPEAPSVVPPNVVLPKDDTFWTACHHCKMQYQYVRIYLNKTLLCPKCRKGFVAVEIESPACKTKAPAPSGKRKISDQQTSTYGNMKNPSPVPSTGCASFPNVANAGSHDNQNAHFNQFRKPDEKQGISNSAKAVDGASSQGMNLDFERVKQRYEARCQAMAKEKMMSGSPCFQGPYATDAVNRIFHANLGGSSSEVKQTFPPIPEELARKVKLSSNDIMRKVEVAMQKDTGSASGDQGQHPNVIKIGTKSYAAGDFTRGKAGNRQTSILKKDVPNIDLRGMLMKKARNLALLKLENLKIDAEAKLAAREKARQKKKQKPSAAVKEKAVSNEDRHDEKEAKRPKLRNKESEFKEEGQMKKSLDESSDKVEQDPVGFDVPDPDFHDFDKDRSESAFEAEQIWAVYDNEDGMPRFYALIQKVMSRQPFQVRMSYLTSRTNSEFGSLNWVDMGFAKVCGDFRVGKYETCDSLNVFSHVMKSERGPRGTIKIIPRKSETWALYRNWSPEWNEHTPDDVMYKYDMVEVLEDYNENEGIVVAPLLKYAGFKTVFFRSTDPNDIVKIPKAEMFRFSHQVPYYLLTGEEGENVPSGCHELDPASTPLELLHVITEPNHVKPMETSEFDAADCKPMV